MISKQTIKNNDELYEDIELIPLNLDAVQHRIDYFKSRVDEFLDDEKYNHDELNKFHKAYVFWVGIKDKHCVKNS